MHDDPARAHERAGTVEQQAADWLSRRERGFAPNEQEEFDNWLLEDPRHAAAAKQMETSWRYLQKPRLAGQTTELLQEIELLVARRSRRRRRIYGWSVAALAAAAMIVLTFVSFRPRETAAPVAQGRIQEKPDRLPLPDGSVVELNAQAEIVPDFTDARRNVRLLAGTALFTVAKDPNRPFVVTIGDVAVQAVGTEFCVQSDPKSIDVLVTEGRVKVDRTTPSVDVKEPPTAVVSVAHRVVIRRDAPTVVLQVQPVPAQAMHAALRWRNQRVEITDMSLQEVVELFNRQNELKLEAESNAAEVRVSGIFWLDDPESASRLIALSAGLEAIHLPGQRIKVRQP